MRHLLLLRERLGMDTNPNPTTKTEKDVCNLAARAATSPVHMVIPQSPQTPVKDPQQILPEREYNQREQELMLKCLNLVQGKCSAFPPPPPLLYVALYNIYFDFSAGRYNKPEPNDTQTQSDVSPSDEGCADMTVSCISSNSMEYVLRIDLTEHASIPFRIFAFLFYLNTTNWHNIHTHITHTYTRKHSSYDKSFALHSD